MHTLDTPDDKVRATLAQRSALRQMTCEQLLHLGMSQVVYLKSGMCDGEMLFMLYSADGTPIVATDDVVVAIEAAADRGLNFVNLHCRRSCLAPDLSRSKRAAAPETIPGGPSADQKQANEQSRRRSNEKMPDRCLSGAEVLHTLCCAVACAGAHACGEQHAVPRRSRTIMAPLPIFM